MNGLNKRGIIFFVVGAVLILAFFYIGCYI